MYNLVGYDKVLEYIQTNGGSEIICYNAGYDTIQYVDRNGDKMYILIDEDEDEFMIEDENQILDSGDLTIDNIISALENIDER